MGQTLWLHVMFDADVTRETAYSWEAKLDFEGLVHVLGAIDLARSLLKSGRFAEADAELAMAASRFHEDRDVLIRYADQAMRAGNWVEAADRWLLLRNKFPDNPFGWALGARTLLIQGHLDDAEKLVEDALSRFPDDVGALETWAELPMKRKDWITAQYRWAQVRQKLPGNLAGFLRGAAAHQEGGDLKGMEGLIRSGLERFPKNRQLLVEIATVLVLQDRHGEADAVWNELLETKPSDLQTIIAYGRKLRECHRYEMAEKVFLEAQSQFPNDSSPVVELAFLSHVRRQFDDASRRWEIVRQRFPSVNSGYIFGALDLKYQGRFEEAETLLLEALDRFPNDANVHRDFASLFHERQLWSEAFARWLSYIKLFPTHIDGYLQASVAARESGDYDAAEKLVSDAILRFRESPRPMIDHARLAQHRGDWGAAAERWKALIVNFPADPEGYIGLAGILRAESKVAEAEELLARGEQLNQHSARLSSERAYMSLNAHNWPEAESRFAAIRERFPFDPVGWLGGSEVLVRQGRTQEATELLQSGMRAHPAEPALALQHARLPIDVTPPKRDWSLAILRLQRMRELFPDYEAGFVASVRILRDAEHGQVI